MLLSDVCLSRTSGLTRKQRGLGRLKLAKRLHVTRTPLSRSKGQRSRSPGSFTHRCVGASGSCSGGRRNVLAVINCCYVAVCSAARGASALTGRGEGRGHIVAAARLQLVSIVFNVIANFRGRRCRFGFPVVRVSGCCFHDISGKLTWISVLKSTKMM